jgi:hypothetical protein
MYSLPEEDIKMMMAVMTVMMLMIEFEKASM